MSDLTNLIIGQRNYKLLEKIGGGGMASVWLSRDPIGSEYAAKLLNEEKQAESPDSYLHYLHCFGREAALLGDLRHPQIPAILDHFGLKINNIDSYAIIMQFVKGASLRKMLDEKKKVRQNSNSSGFTEQWAVDLLTKFCEPIHYAHTLGVLHRDIKPENIILGDCFTPFAIDWGIAKNIRMQHPGGKTEAVGTDGYCPIEQYDPAAEKDERTDIYSFGATLFELITGKTPANAPSRANYERRYRQPHRVEDDKIQNKGLEELLNFMMRVDIKDRPASMQFVQDELKKLLYEWDKTVHGVYVPPNILPSPPPAIAAAATTNAPAVPALPAPHTSTVPAITADSLTADSLINSLCTDDFIYSFHPMAVRNFLAGKTDNNAEHVVYHQPDFLHNQEIMGMEKFGRYLILSTKDKSNYKSNAAIALDVEQLISNSSMQAPSYYCDFRITAMKIAGNCLAIGREDGTVVVINLEKWLAKKNNISDDLDECVVGDIKFSKPIRAIEYFNAGNYEYLIVQDAEYLTTINMLKVLSARMFGTKTMLAMGALSPYIISRFENPCNYLNPPLKVHITTPDFLPKWPEPVLFYNTLEKNEYFGNSEKVSAIPLENLLCDNPDLHKPVFRIDNAGQRVCGLDFYEKWMLAHDTISSCINVLDYVMSVQSSAQKFWKYFALGNLPLECFRIVEKNGIVYSSDRTGDFLSISTMLAPKQNTAPAKTSALYIVNLNSTITDVRNTAVPDCTYEYDLSKIDPLHYLSSGTITGGIIKVYETEKPIRMIKAAGANNDYLAVVSGDSALTIIKAFSTQMKIPI